MNEQFKLSISQAQQAFMLGNYEQALNKARMAFLLNPGAVGAYVLAGSACFVMGRMEEAETFYRKAVALDEENGEHHFNLGNCLTAQNRLQEALTCYANAEIHKCSDKTRQKLYFAMGKINQQSGKAQDALLNYKKAESIPGPNPDMAEILLNRTEIYVSLTDWENAENCAMQLKLLLPGEFKSYQLLFQILLQQKKVKQAEEILVEGECYCPYTPENRIEFAFDHTMIHCFMANIEPENQEQHFNNALSWLNKLEQLPNLSKNVRTEILLTRTEIFLRLDRMDQAMEMATSIASSSDPDLTEYIEKARFLLVNCYKQQGNLESMRSYAAQLKTSRNLLYRHHGYYCEFWAVKEQSKADMQLSKRVQDLYDRAIAYYKKSAVENVGDVLSYTYRAQVYADMGKFDKADQLCDMLPEDVKNQLKDHINNCRQAQD